MKVKFLMGALALTLIVASCGGKDEPKKANITTGGTTTTEVEVKDIALELNGKKYASGSEIALGSLTIKQGYEEGQYEIEAPALDVVALDKSFIGDGYELMVQKSSHLDNASVGLGSVCLNICLPVDGPVESVTLPTSKDDPSITIYDPNDAEHKTDNQVLIHYGFKGEAAASKASGQTFKLKLTLRRAGKVVYTAHVSFETKK